MTYLSHFNLKEKPFKLSPDPRFMWFSEAHKEAWASLHFGVLDRRGFILLIGDVGTGKTTVINKLVEGLDENVVVARISDPGLNQLDFFKFLAEPFGLRSDFGSKGEFLFRLTRFLNRAFDSGKTVVVIIDEAQRLTDEMLEEIRLLSNIERQNEKMINLILVGQNEINEKLMTDANRALRQRITTVYTLQPLAESEVEEFIRFRLKVAGTEENLFTGKAVREITLFSKGNPRLINVICDQALLTAFVQEKHRVDDKIVRQCAKELTFAARENGKKKPEVAKEERKNDQTPWFLILLYNSFLTGAVIVILVLLALVGIKYYNPQLFQQVVAREAPAKNGRLTYPVRTEEATSGMAGPLKGMAPSTEAQRTPAVEPRQPEAKAETPASEGFAQTAAPVQPPASVPEAADGPPPAAAATVKSVPLPQAETSEAQPVADLPPWPTAKTVLHFPYNSNEISDERYSELKQLVDVIKSRPGTRVVITGYTDGFGNLSYNQNLSKFRADIVKSYFVGQGIDSSQITSVGRGPENPIASDASYQGRGMNRRVEIELIAAQ